MQNKFLKILIYKISSFKNKYNFRIDYSPKDTLMTNNYLKRLSKIISY